MNSDSQFAALEIMSRERAALARKEMEYWLAEAEEWRHLREASGCPTDSSVTARYPRQAQLPAKEDNA